MRSSTCSPAGRTVMARVREPGRPDDLLGHGALGLLELVAAGRGRDVEHLAHAPP